MRVLGWTFTRDARGVTRVTPPAGRAHAWIEVRERERPLVPMRTLIAGRAAELGGADVVAQQRFVTAEGEHAAVATLTGAREEHTLAVVYTDDHMLTVDGRAVADDQRAAVREGVRELAQNLPCGLGEHRFRSYDYAPPAGWHGVARGLVTTWYAPEFPRVPAWIRVLPARPARLPVAVTQVDTLMHDDPFTTFRPETRLLRGEPPLDGFHCIISRVAGRFASPQRDDSRRMLITAGLMDGRFVHGLRLDSGEANAAEHEQVFLALVRSCRPVPTPAPSAAQGAEVFAYWIE